MVSAPRMLSFKDFLACSPSYLISLSSFSFLTLLSSCHLVWFDSYFCDWGLRFVTQVHWVTSKIHLAHFSVTKSRLKQRHNNNGIMEWYFLEVPLQLQWPGHFLRQRWGMFNGPQWMFFPSETWLHHLCPCKLLAFVTSCGNEFHHWTMFCVKKCCLCYSEPDICYLHLMHSNYYESVTKKKMMIFYHVQYS